LSLLSQLIAMQWCMCYIFVLVLKLYCSRHPAFTFTDSYINTIDNFIASDTLSVVTSRLSKIRFFSHVDLYILPWCAGSPFR
jgi:hypothetical protein